MSGFTLQSSQPANRPNMLNSGSGLRIMIHLELLEIAVVCGFSPGSSKAIITYPVSSKEIVHKSAKNSGSWKLRIFRWRPTTNNSIHIVWRAGDGRNHGPKADSDIANASNAHGSPQKLSKPHVKPCGSLERANSSQIMQNNGRF